MSELNVVHIDMSEPNVVHNGIYESKIVDIHRIFVSIIDMYVVITGDVVGSTKFSMDRRREIQIELKAILDDLNEHNILKDGIVSEFSISRGDEIQGLLQDVSNPFSYIRYIQICSGEDWRMRFGIGRGELSTEFRPRTTEMDGECFYKSRDAINMAKAKEFECYCLGYFIERGKTKINLDIIINLLLKNFYYVYSGFTVRQRKIYDFKYYIGKSVNEIQAEMNYKSNRSIFKELSKEHIKIAIENEMALSQLFMYKDISFPKQDDKLIHFARMG